MKKDFALTRDFLNGSKDFFDYVEMYTNRMGGITQFSIKYRGKDVGFLRDRAVNYMLPSVCFAFTFDVEAYKSGKDGDSESKVNGVYLTEKYFVNPVEMRDYIDAHFDDLVYLNENLK